jgi:hypothetical protein
MNTTEKSIAMRLLKQCGYTCSNGKVGAIWVNVGGVDMYTDRLSQVATHIEDSEPSVRRDAALITLNTMSVTAKRSDIKKPVVKPVMRCSESQKPMGACDCKKCDPALATLREAQSYIRARCSTVREDKYPLKARRLTASLALVNAAITAIESIV